MKIYPAYKDSGVEWIGEIPTNWSLPKIKHIISKSLAYGVLKPDKYEGKDGIPLVRIMDINDGVVNCDTLEIISPSQDREYKRTKLSLNDLVVSVVGTLGRCFIVSKSLVGANLSRALARIQVEREEIAVNWLRYYFYTHMFEVLTDITAMGTAQRVLNLGDLSNFIIPRPEIREQQAIADYLNKKTALIDGLIEKKKRQIELLKEQRQAVINQAVTKGLDPDVEMKDSGIEWLGKIPKHWKVVKITYACSKINDGTHFSPESDFTGERLYITAKNIKESGVQISNATYITEEAHRVIYQRCPVVKGDVLYIKDGATAGIATVNQLDEEFSLLSSVALIRPIEEVLLANYLVYQLNDSNFKSSVLNSLVGGAMTRFTVEIIKSFRLVVPPVAEQQRIIKYLGDVSKDISLTVTKAEKQIELLQEYRTALISEAVTGKIDVREAV